MKRLLPIILGFNLLLSLCLSNTTTSYATSSTNSSIQVKLSAYLGNQSSVNTSISGKYIVQEDGLVLDGAYHIKNESGQLVLYKNGIKIKNYGSSFQADPVVYNTKNIISINGRNYLGSMRFIIESGKYIRPYNTLPIEDYLKGVVSQEMSPSWGSSGGMEALKAQAIAARTYATGVSPIDDGQTDQVYTGFYWYTNTNHAVEDTQGQVLKYNGQVIGANALYSSSNGGKTLSKVNSWGDASWNRVPYLQVKEDPYDLKSASLGNQLIDWSFSLTKTQVDLTGVDLSNPSSWWNEKREISVEQPILKNMKNWLQANGYIDKKYEIKISRIEEISFDTNVPSNETIDGHLKINYMLRDTTTNRHEMENGTIKLFTITIDNKAYTFRNMISSSIMKSPYIKSVVDNGTKFTVNGGGWGHGIGMSQFGAYQMSKEGKTYKEILTFYYPGTTLADVLGPTVTNMTASTSGDNVVTLNYSLDEEAITTITINDPQKSIITGKVQPKGQVQFTWDASSLSNGTYAYALLTKDKNGNSTNMEGSFIVYNKKDEKIRLFKETSLFTSTSLENKTEHFLAPQIISVIEREEEWFKVKTLNGDKWIKPDLYSIVGDKKTKGINRSYSILIQELQKK